MKFLSSCLTLAATLCWTHAYAQKYPFEGASVGLNATLDSATTDLKFGTSKISSLGWTSQGASLQGSWGWSAGQSAIFSIGGSYNLSDVSSGDFGSTAGALSLKKRNAYSVYIEPGFKLSAKTLAYAKLGYEGASMRRESAGGTVDKDMDGVSYGFGARTFVGDNVYIQGEIKQVFYTSTSFPGLSDDFKAAGTSGLVGIGYQF